MYQKRIFSEKKRKENHVACDLTLPNNINTMILATFYRLCRVLVLGRTEQILTRLQLVSQIKAIVTLIRKHARIYLCVSRRDAERVVALV